MAQNEAKNWYFGYGGGNLNFNFYPPQSGQGYTIWAKEAIATISDEDGNLLFNTNGEQVYNKNHQLMFNGKIGGHHSSTQILILPHPGAKDQYFIFKPPSLFDDPFLPDNPHYSLKYSIVDMQLDNGLGDVVVKDIVLFDYSTEKVTAVKHCNKIDYWVIAQKWKSNEFWVYLLSEEGMDTVPVISKAGSVLDAMNDHHRSHAGVGELKPNQSGNLLANAIFLFGNFRIELLRFNNKTGGISYHDEILLDNRYGPSSVEFSPNDRFLYIASGSLTLSAIKQIDLEDFLKRHYITDSVVHQYYQMSLGPDGKIYIATSINIHRLPNVGLSCFTVIHNPNEKGTDLKITPQAYCFDEIIIGLPSFPYNIYKDAINSENHCYGDITTFSTTVCEFDSIKWDFKDPPQQGVFVNTSSVTHRFSKPGTYNVMAVVFNKTRRDTFYHELTINDIPRFSLGNDTTLCLGNSWLISPDGHFDNYTWHNGSNDSVFLATEAGVYSLTVEHLGCTATASVRVEYEKPEEFAISNNYVCPGSSTELTVNLKHRPHVTKGFSWQNLVQSNTYTVYEPGPYFFNYISKHGCRYSDTVKVEEVCAPTLYLPNAFSPGNDEINDVFKPAGTYIGSYHLKVFSRWGQLVFESNDPTIGWDGSLNGKPCPEGMYVYILIYTGKGNFLDKVYLKGEVILIRGH